MNKTVLCFFLGVTILVNTGCNAEGPERSPAVAGQFYPADPAELRSMLDELFRAAKPRADGGRILGLILPHAGYIYSGQVAASGVNQLSGDEEYDTVFLIGTSHNFGFGKAAVYSSGSFVTPLGKVEVDNRTAAELLENKAIFSDNSAPHIPEHCLEVELPFLQFRLKKPFRIVPILLGELDVASLQALAAALSPRLNERNLFVISSDFTHYPTYADAKKVDADTLAAILTGSPGAVMRSVASSMDADHPGLVTCACGLSAILTFLYMSADRPGIAITAVSSMNSGDTEIGSKDRVVGYHAIAFSESKEKKTMKKDMATDFELSSKDRKNLLGVARKTIEGFVTHGRAPAIEASGFSSNLSRPCGAFVTLNEKGHLRGCIGNFTATGPLYQVVERMAVAAASEDPRFTPVLKAELPRIDIEISVLSPMRKIKSVDEIRLGTHGIYIRKGGRSGTFLPQVATETGWSLEEFLGHCSEDKAGLGWDGWKTAEIYVYTAIVFGERE